MAIAVTTGSRILRSLLFLGGFLLGGLLSCLSCKAIFFGGRGRFPLFLKFPHSSFELTKHRFALWALGSDRHPNMRAACGAYLLVDLNVRHPLLPLSVAFKRPRPEAAPCQVFTMLSENCEAWKMRGGPSRSRSMYQSNTAS